MNEFTVCLAGDTSLGDWYLRNLKKEKLLKRLYNNPDSFFELLKPLLAGTDELILNLETVLNMNPPIYFSTKKYTNWDNPNITIPVLKKLGVTTVNLCNNHSMDYGPETMLSTKSLLTEESINVFGVGENDDEALSPSVISIYGTEHKLNLYFIAAMRAGRKYYEDYSFFATKDKPGIASFYDLKLEEKIKRIKLEDNNSFIVLSPHWQGYDYKWVSDDEKVVRDCYKYIDFGVDLVIGHGPHMINDILTYRNKTIFFSIGNFVFNSPGRYGKLNAPPYSCLVKLIFRETLVGWDILYRCYPIVTDNKTTKYASRPVNRNEAIDLFNLLQHRSDHSSKMTLNEDGIGYYFEIQPLTNIEQ
jgi:hypothetical protein